MLKHIVLAAFLTCGAIGAYAQNTNQASAPPRNATTPAPAPVPTTKAKPGTTAYCQTLKSSSSRSACMKKLHAQATPKAAPTTTKKKTKKTTTTASQPDVGQLSPPPATSAPAPAQTGGTVAVPPLPQKTI